MKDGQARAVLRDGAGKKWLHFTSPCGVVTTRRMDQVVPLIRQIADAVERDGVYAAGFISYEAAPAFDPSLPSKEDGEFPLLWFGLFRHAGETATLPNGGRVNLPSSWQPSVTNEEYRRCLRSIREWIRKGDTYQVNFTYRLQAETAVEPWDLFVHMMEDQDPPFGGFVDTGQWAVCSASPELFLRLDGDHIESRPMKGTAARGLWYENDREKAAALLSSEKERAENVMIADMVRNDLGRVALCGSVHVPSLFAVEQYPTVWQMTTTVRARTHASLDQILQAAFPPASCTGAPKRRAMEIIAELETSPRRIYTGALGFIAPGRRAQFNVAIRTLLIHRPSGRSEYGVGGGIVWDSNPDDELNECAIKARVLHPLKHDFDLLETMQWSPHKGYFLLEYHLTRLAQSADYFGFHIDRRRIQEELGSLAAGLSPAPHRIRLVVARRGGFRCETAPIKADSMRFDDIPLAMNPIDSKDVFLYHKTSHRRAYEDATRARPGSEDVLLFNAAGEITESTVANVAVEIDGVLCTPPLDCGLLPGTYRAWMLDRGQMRERVVRIEEALRSPNVYLMNSIRGMHRFRILAP